MEQTLYDFTQYYLTIFAWSCVCIAVAVLFSYNQGKYDGKIEETEKWFKKCDECDKNETYNID